MTMNPAYGARNRHTGFAPNGTIKGLSALDLVVQAGLLADTAGPLEFANWLRAPVDEIVGDLTSLVVPIVDAAMAGYMGDITDAMGHIDGQVSAANVILANTEAARDDTLEYRNEAQQIVDDFNATAPTALTTTELLLGTDAVKYATAAAIKGTTDPAAITFTATPAPDFTATSYRTMTLTGNITSVGAPVGMKVGQSYTVDFVEDATGGRTFPASGSWNAAYDWTSEGFPASFATGANKRNTVSLFCYATDKAWARLTKSA